MGMEDQEVESGALATQAWDLEAFDLTGTTLTLWAGYNLKDGETQGSTTWRPGDIFIDVNGDAVWGDAISGRPTSNAYYNWDYVIDIDYSSPTLSYSIYSLDSSSEFIATYDWSGNKFDWSNPWLYSSGGTLVGTGEATWLNDGSNPLGLLGTGHNSLSVDVGFLGAELDGALFSYTMECGNDGIKGQASVPDGGATVVLLGIGLAGIAGVNRFKRSDFRGGNRSHPEKDCLS